MHNEKYTGRELFKDGSHTGKDVWDSRDVRTVALQIA